MRGRRWLPRAGPPPPWQRRSSPGPSLAPAARHLSDPLTADAGGRTAIARVPEPIPSAVNGRCDAQPGRGTGIEMDTCRGSGHAVTLSSVARAAWERG